MASVGEEHKAGEHGLPYPGAQGAQVCTICTDGVRGKGGDGSGGAGLLGLLQVMLGIGQGGLIGGWWDFKLKSDGGNFNGV